MAIDCRQSPGYTVKPLRVLRISHSAVVSAYRERERVLSRCWPLELKLILPLSWPHIGIEAADCQESFELVRAKTYITGSIPLFIFDARPLVRALREFQPHIVDIHEEPYSLSAFQAFSLARRYAPDARCVFYSAQNIFKSYPPPFCWTERYVLDLAAAAYPCSQLVAEVLRRKGFRKPAPVIPLGVDPDVFKPSDTAYAARKGRKEGAFELIYVGRIEYQKGLSYLVEALAELTDRLNWRLTLVGSGAYEGDLLRKATDLNCVKRIRLFGEVPASQIAEILPGYDALVLPSISTRSWREQFGRAAIEAMACGVPVIVSDSGSLPEVVADCGLIARERNSQELSQAIEKLAASEELKQTLRQRALERARRLFTWHAVAESMFRLYLEVSGQSTL